MFGRGKSQQAQIITEAPAKVGGKGRPTPSRREAQQRNRQPLVGGGPRLAPNATKAEKKAARQARRQAMSADRALTQQAMLTGDERHLPVRDRGPARRFARDYVDARRSVGEFFIPIALVILGMSLINSPLIRLASVLMLYTMVLLMGVDGFLLRRKLMRLTGERFDAKSSKGVGMYAVMRSMQIRRTRLPRPQVTRGQFPV